MKYCPNCNKHIENDAQRFCTVCGASLIEKNTCPKCNTENSPKYTFCIKCGTPLKGNRNTPSQAPTPINYSVKKENKNNNTKLMIIAAAAAVVVIAGLAFYFFSGSHNQSNVASKVTEPQKNTSQSQTEQVPQAPSQSTIPSNTPIPPQPPAFPQITSNAIVNASHSSADHEGNYIHSASLAIDGNIQSCWSEGAPEWGVGEFITIYFDGTYKVRGMNIWTGHQKSLELFRQNGRPVAVRVIGSDGSNEQYYLEDRFGMQKVTFRNPINVQNVRITVEGISPGSKYKDTCIAEVNFF